MHCRTLNQHVAASFEEWQSSAHNILPLVGRGAAVWPRSPGVLAGCSSFGMSGVNAHALLAAPHEDGCILGNEMAWRQRRHWPVLDAHHMLASTFKDTDREAGVRCAPLVWLQREFGVVVPFTTVIHILTHRVNLPILRFQSYLASPALGFLLDHVVQGQSILPGAGMLEACTARSISDISTGCLP